REIAENLCLGSGCQRKGEERYFAKVSCYDFWYFTAIIHADTHRTFRFQNSPFPPSVRLFGRLASTSRAAKAYGCIPTRKGDLP
ncbi:hypothetical protein QZH63_10870, partial [Eikenella corrodens]|nr:hypothetical protein [Eikenella corrodens]